MVTSQNWSALSVEELEAEVRYHNRKYWIEDQPEISDPDFDQLVERLREVAPDSPVLEAIGPAGADLEDLAEDIPKIQHDPPMLSLDKCYDEATLLKWFDKFEGKAIATPKIDGVAVSVRYDQNGNFYAAATRGNGITGEIITENVRYIQDLPKTLDIANVEVRGEAYMPLSVFEEKFKGTYASPRNLTAGAMKLKDSRKTSAYEIHFFAYDLLGVEFETEQQKLEKLISMGFVTAAPMPISRDDLQQAFDAIEAQRHVLNYEMDGVVYKANAIEEQQRMGCTAHHPRYAIAYKFQGEAGMSILREVHWSVSRTGAINPVGIVDPVELSGAVVTRVSLHNLAIMRALGGEEGLKLNSRVLMMRRGGVIPNLEQVIEPGDHPVEIPARCPSCLAETFEQNDVLYALHAPDCRHARIRQIEHFAQVMDIKGLGPKLLEQLYDHRLVTEPADLYTLTVQQLIGLERVGVLLAEKLITRIQEKRQVDAEVFFRALGIEELGKHVSKILAHHCKDLDEALAISPETLASIHTIGDIIAHKVTEGFVRYREVIDDLLKHVAVVFPVDDSKADEATGPLANKKVLFTGALSSMTRTQAQQHVEQLGGESPSSVVKDLDYLVLGDADMEKFRGGWRSSKLKKAENYIQEGAQISIISESEFLGLLEGESAKNNTNDTNAAQHDGPQGKLF